MKTLFIDCGMGAAGDMLSAALYELLDEKEKAEFLAEVNSIGIPGVVISADSSEKCGIHGTHITVKVNGTEEDEHLHNHEGDAHHDHHDFEDIESIVSGLSISNELKSDVMNIYRIIAEAESRVHGVSVTDIHFHEVGKMDAIADIVSVCLLMNRVSPQKIMASPVNVGSGTVKCAHGILPVPAPATVEILNGVPMYSGQVSSELCTPTGAALLKYFVNEFSQMPAITTDRIGYGMGKKDFPVANCVRVILGETEDENKAYCTPNDCVTELTFNIDDMTGELIGFAMNRILDGGALEVFTTPVNMKKNRPGIMMTVICKAVDKASVLELIFKHTTTIGVRERVYDRYILSRRIETMDTPLGKVRKKKSEGYGIVREKYEYEDIADIAIKNDMSVAEVISVIDNLQD